MPVLSSDSRIGSWPDPERIPGGASPACRAGSDPHRVAEESRPSPEATRGSQGRSLGNPLGPIRNRGQDSGKRRSSGQRKPNEAPEVESAAAARPARAWIASLFAAAAASLPPDAERFPPPDDEQPAPEWLAAYESALAGLVHAASYSVWAEESRYAPSPASRARIEAIRDLASRGGRQDLEDLQLFSVEAYVSSPGEQVRDHVRRSARITRKGGLLLEQHFFGGLPIDPEDRRHEVAILGTPEYLVIHHPDEPSLFVQARQGSYAFLELSHILAPITAPGESAERDWFPCGGAGWVALPSSGTPALSPRSRLARGFVRRTPSRVQWLAFDADSGVYPVLFLEHESTSNRAVLMWLTWTAGPAGELLLRRVACDRLAVDGSLRAVYEIGDWRSLAAAGMPTLEVGGDTWIRDQRFHPPRASRVWDRAIPGLEARLRVIPARPPDGGGKEGA